MQSEEAVQVDCRIAFHRGVAGGPRDLLAQFLFPGIQETTL